VVQALSGYRRVNVGHAAFRKCTSRPPHKQVHGRSNNLVCVIIDCAANPFIFMGARIARLRLAYRQVTTRMRSWPRQSVSLGCNDQCRAYGACRYSALHNDRPHRVVRQRLLVITTLGSFALRRAMLPEGRTGRARQTCSPHAGVRGLEASLAASCECQARLLPARS